MSVSSSSRESSSEESAGAVVVEVPRRGGRAGMFRPPVRPRVHLVGREHVDAPEFSLPGSNDESSAAVASSSPGRVALAAPADTGEPRDDLDGLRLRDVIDAPLHQRCIGRCFRDARLERMYCEYLYGYGRDKPTKPYGIIFSYFLSVVTHLMSFFTMSSGDIVWFVCHGVLAGVFFMVAIFLLLVLPRMTSCPRRHVLAEVVIGISYVLVAFVMTLRAVIPNENQANTFEFAAFAAPMAFWVVVTPRVVFAYVAATIGWLTCPIASFVFGDGSVISALLVTIEFVLAGIIGLGILRQVSAARRNRFVLDVELQIRHRKLARRLMPPDAPLSLLLPPDLLRAVRSGVLEGQAQKKDDRRCLSIYSDVGCLLECDLIGFSTWCSVNHAQHVAESFDLISSLFDFAADEMKLKRVRCSSEGWMAYGRGIRRKYFEIVRLAVVLVRLLGHANRILNENFMVRIGAGAGVLRVVAWGSARCGGPELTWDVFGRLRDCIDGLRLSAQPNSLNVNRRLQIPTQWSFKYEKPVNVPPPVVGRSRRLMRRRIVPAGADEASQWSRYALLGLDRPLSDFVNDQSSRTRIDAVVGRGVHLTGGALVPSGSASPNAMGLGPLTGLQQLRLEHTRLPIFAPWKKCVKGVTPSGLFVPLWTFWPLSVDIAAYRYADLTSSMTFNIFFPSLVCLWIL